MTDRPSSWRVWLVAVRPFAYTASVLPVLIGMGLAHAAGYPARWGLFALCLVGVAAFHTGANLLNDAADYERGLDTEVLPTSGAIVRGWLTPDQVKRGARIALLAGFLCGAVLVWQAGWVVLALGLAGGLLTVLYTRKTGFCLKYAGWGDPVIFLTFSLMPLVGTWWVQTRVLSWLPLALSLAPGSLAVAILHANNWRDLARDRPAGCSTLAGRLGPGGSCSYYRFLTVLPYAVAAGMLAWGESHSPALVFLSLPLAVRLIRRAPEPAFLARLDASTARLHLVFGLLLVIALAFPFALAEGKVFLYWFIPHNCGLLGLRVAEACPWHPGFSGRSS